MKPEISIAGRQIGQDFAPYIIAELSANHNGKLETALKIIEEAAKAGADAVKLQTYRPDTITLDSDADEFKSKAGFGMVELSMSSMKKRICPGNGTNLCLSMPRKSAFPFSAPRLIPLRWICSKT